MCFMFPCFHSGGDGQDAPMPVLVDGEVKYKEDSIVRHWISGEFASFWFFLLGITCLRHCG